MLPEKKHIGDGTTIGRTFGSRVRDVRQRHGWSQRELANRLTAAGRPMGGAMVAKIEEAGRTGGETTRADNVTVSDLLIFAAVLGVSPLHLIVPLDGDRGANPDLGPDHPDQPSSTETHLTAELSRIAPPEMRAWIRGLWPLHHRGPWNDGQSEDYIRRVFLTEAPLGEVTERRERRAEYESRAADRAAISRVQQEAGRDLSDEELARRARPQASKEEIARVREVGADALYVGDEE